ncbi:hypothetical protein SAMN04488518_104350 [Pseudovibrio ascidiaceicola]|uniref:HTH merR-type domain-containing protein n=2 Tax=Pseudovibrio ascidiaceicola TaxID=285279 RepID=A0A1I3Z0V6_9HYPH|nr:hypothetical protein SAMN04488518_104350 [Pseudovibrio ascidiaceicola]
MGDQMSKTAETLRKGLSQEQQETLDILLADDERTYLEYLSGFSQEELQKYLDGMQVVGLAKQHEQRALLRFNERRHKLAAVVEVSKISKITLRNWLTRGQLKLDAEDGHTKSGWRAFSERDTIHITLAAHLSRMGVPVTHFDDIITPILKFIEGLATRSHGFATEPLFLITNENGWDLQSYGGGTLPKPDELPSVYMVVNPAKILNEVMTGLYGPQRG